MRLNLDELQEYCMMFPIAYYAGQPLPLCAAKVTTSCANIVTKEILISLSQVNSALDKAERADAFVIRPIVYHEVSHVILTPTRLTEGVTHIWRENHDYYEILHDKRFSDSMISVADLVNVFEDERIECIMRDAYMEVDFYDNVCKLNNWSGARLPKDPYQAFYDIVRFHETVLPGIKWHQFYNRSRQLIIKWAGLNPNSSYEDVCEYCDDIYNLYHDLMYACADMFEQMKEIEEAAKKAEEEAKRAEEEAKYDKQQESFDEYDSDEPSEDGQSEDEPSEDGQSEDDDYDIDIVNPDPVQTGSDKNEDDSLSNDESDESEESGNQSGSVEEDDEEDDDPIVNAKPAKPNVDMIRKQFRDFVFDRQDEKVKALLSQKFFIKDMHGHQMGAIHKHSGKLDVKAVGRKDWKIFKQPSMFSDGSRIGKKMHLILVLDQSGSYAGNDFATNLILASLVSAEQHIKAFEFTVLKFGNGFHVCNKNERYSESNQGTEFSVKLFRQIEALKRPDCANFVIFLNDGAAWTNDSWFNANRDVKNALKKALDHDNCVCILDHDAYSTWFTGVKNAKVIVTDDYVNQLSNNVCDALSAMLAV